ncbi:hypothetical protein [Austwickia chelonae]|uniref:hypothetical protein n=1 Tax=Austwickia chelonae TaxID=100225 RepID=UPI0013C2D6B9|nr:hypothetical protein [Austwickia chelonae]
MSRDGLSIGYRIGWRLRKLAMTFFGPAQLSSDQDPMAKLHAEREAKIAEARTKRAASGS